MKQIPNILTGLNALSGCMALVYLSESHFYMALVWVITAAVFDFLDGFAAKLLHAKSDLGVQLDSLADVISFGLVPGFAAMKFLAPHWGDMFALTGFLITLSSVYRLGKFNLTPPNDRFFVGLPTPANALAIVAIMSLEWDSGAVLAIVFLSSILLNTPIKIVSLKPQLTDNFQNIFLGLFAINSVLSVIYHEILAIPLLVFEYVVFGSIIAKFRN